LHIIDMLEKGDMALLRSPFAIRVRPDKLGRYLGEVREIILIPRCILARIVHQLIEMVLLKLP
jgi:hypothetical protein